MFVALYPPGEVVAELSGCLAQMKRQDPHAEAAVRWSPPEQWHLTLAFMPSVDEVKLARLSEALAEVATSAARAPEMSVAGAGRFGVTALWWALSLDDAAAQWLAQLARHVRRATRAVGVVTDDSRWRPHITIGRVRRDAPAGTARHWVRTLDEVTSAVWVPADLVLVTSVTGPVVSHTATNRWPLG